VRDHDHARDHDFIPEITELFFSKQSNLNSLTKALTVKKSDDA
jgi:hypothetical protein